MFSKTDLASMLQCPRKLWLEKHRPEDKPLKDSTGERREMDGHLVNEKARELLGARILWPARKDDHQEAMELALEALAANPGVPAVEFPMFREDLYCRADGILPLSEEEGGGYVLQETKSSTFPLKTDKETPAPAKEHFIDDLAIQAWTAEATGLPITRYELNLLNSKWIYQGDNDYEGVFRPKDVTDIIHERKTFVPVWLQQARDVVAGPMPEMTTGSQCKKPYDCPFVDQCKAMEPEGEKHPLTLLPDLAGKNLARELAEMGYTSLVDVPSSLLETSMNSEMYLRIQKAHQTGQAQLDERVRQMLRDLPYPRYWFDFEGIDLPVPRWDGVRPYEQIPFQWSCHVQRSPTEFEHYAFLDVSGNDPSLGCIERMREVINESDAGPIVVYYQTYEKTRMKELALRHPEFKDLMNLYISRLVDLHPIVKDNYYHPDMKGSFSIKKVLPTIAPDLRYEDLEQIQEGTGAQVGYLHAAFSPLSRKEREALVRNALAYCEQDTWAMVLVGLYLANEPRPALPAPDMSPLHSLKTLSAKERGELVRKQFEPKPELMEPEEFEDIGF